MTQMQGLDIKLPATVSEETQTEIGLSQIELGYVQLLLKHVLPPDKAEAVCRVIQNVAASMNTLAELSRVSEALMLEASAQRDVAVSQRDQALIELDQLMNAVQQIDQSNPAIADLVLTVWNTAQADLLAQQSQRGA